ncbi:putative phosphoenolpyruvate carboxylase [Gluconacetobacter diazotrophicus PA1 5]|uniref:Phosphoenolpyruvate carboxylase n=1 Tax=Gluconacetobacter diazotrophicus TaxID=33996 RepID=A0A7W4I6K0_GLUDI|nr:phosphoenolpyruvate carboxylase [Gluconacetobacter diazotrophicus]ACI53033.1 putative phosphoenolpyruvate carboxylase [Gluconacetobacter diazotrophicus PA1 5]MBB2157176.1 phosphoenolpyruvate carboxylase [Gluconacetobacter diazotrophicus]TWB07704.1 phosphoenolpyruvate carboxylase type 1 [Gluconacetobacter diazotrophicus]
MTDTPTRDAAEMLLDLTRQAVADHENSSSGNPIIALARRIGRQLTAGTLTTDTLEQVVRQLRDTAFRDRAARLHAYVGGTDDAAIAGRMRGVAQTVASEPGPDGTPPNFGHFRKNLERSRFAAVFTAHPTFALANPVYDVLATLASSDDGRTGTVPALATHRRPAPPTLEEEFALASAAIVRGRNALDRLTGILLAEARTRWPHEWSVLSPRPVILTTWVGYDTDGRTDIGWWDTIRLRLRMKRLQLERLRDQITPLRPVADGLHERVARALDAVTDQIEACPVGAAPGPDSVAAFAAVLIGRREDAIMGASELASSFQEAIDTAPPDDRMALAIARAGLMAHGMAAAHTHVRLNSTQIHNVARQRLGIDDSPEIPSQRRALLSRINEALDHVQPVNIDFGSLLVEQATAARLMMTVRQIVRHIDRESPVRFLIAETESGYTLLAALWLARTFGIEEHVEISPLFETQEALENGAHIVEEALHSPHWREYLRRTGKLSLQFGYSDSGRYVGQLAATYLIERLRLKICELLRRWNLTDVEVILFDTHGESIGRGAHPFRLSDRLDYLSPLHARAVFADAGLRIREETAFQGGDGYLLFGTQALADATISIIASHVFAHTVVDRDPVYDQPDFSADFFSTIGAGMAGLVEDPGYAALLGAFGPSLIDKTGSRPSARQSDSGAAASRITHPSQLRAIPNNAILQQLGWCANTIQGLGTAAARHPETFEEFLSRSPRFRRALDFASHALAHSDDTVLRAVVYMLDPDMWLDRATAESDPARRDAYLALMHGLERLNFWASTQAMFRRIQSDHLALRRAWQQAPAMGAEEKLLHAIRIATIERIWLLSTRIPYFSPRNAFSRDELTTRVLCLEIPAALRELDYIFPSVTGGGLDLDYHEDHGPRNEGAYIREHAEIFEPMLHLFNLVRETGTAIMHHVGAFG